MKGSWALILPARPSRRDPCRDSYLFSFLPFLLILLLFCFSLLDLIGDAWVTIVRFVSFHLFRNAQTKTLNNEIPFWIMKNEGNVFNWRGPTSLQRRCGDPRNIWAAISGWFLSLGLLLNRAPVSITLCRRVIGPAPSLLSQHGKRGEEGGISLNTVSYTHLTLPTTPYV